MTIILRAFYAFLLAWTRIDLMIARSSPVLNIRHLEQLRRDEYDYEGALFRVERGL